MGANFASIFYSGEVFSMLRTLIAAAAPALLALCYIYLPQNSKTDSGKKSDCRNFNRNCRTACFVFRFDASVGYGECDYSNNSFGGLRHYMRFCVRDFQKMQRKRAFQAVFVCAD